MLTQANLMAWGFALLILIILTALQWKGKLPTPEYMNGFFSAFNSRGGNIVTLLCLTLLFFYAGLKFIYWTIDGITSGKLSPDNAIVLAGVNWITGAAFGMVLAALLKAMTGENSQGRVSDNNTSGGGVTVTAIPVITNTPSTPTNPQPTTEDAAGTAGTQGNTGV